LYLGDLNMMVIWRGLGFLVPVIGIAALLISRSAINGVFGKGYFREHDWPMYATIGFASLAIAVLGYLLNYRMRGSVSDPETGEVIGKSPSHSLFFVPVQYWAIVIPAIFVYAQMGAAEREQNDVVYLQAPQAGDVYITDLSLLVEDLGTKNKWGVMKVVRVTSDEVEVKAGGTGYAVPSLARSAVRDGEDQAIGYYVEDPLALTRSKLSGFKESGVIHDVFRGSPEESVAQAGFQ
jgi:hypothetical protein